MSTSCDSELEFLPGVRPREMDFSEAGVGGPVVVYPSISGEWAHCGEELAKDLGAWRGAPIESLEDVAVQPDRGCALKAEWKRRPLVLLGGLHTNRLVAPFYAQYRCFTDAVYPGAGGYEVRTLVNPFGTGANVLLLGGSSLTGVRRAVNCLRSKLSPAGEKPGLPFMHEVTVAADLFDRLRNWPHAPLPAEIDDPIRSKGLSALTPLVRGFSSHGLHWSLTGDDRHAEAAAAYLRKLNNEMPEGYGDWHYLAERFLRALPLLAAGGWLDGELLEGTHRRLLHTALGNAGEWWRMRGGEPPLGHRHHGQGTMEFLLLARYLRDQTNPNPALRARCDEWIAECSVFLDALGRAGVDDQDDETTLINLTIPFRYALGEERTEFFTEGHARRVAERALALHDPLGAGSGQGGYGESQGNAPYLQQEASTAVAAAALFYEDGELVEALRSMPHLIERHRYGFLQFCPIFLQNFAPGEGVQPRAAKRLTGVRVLPALAHQVRLNADPPEHVEFRGHMVNAPETWQLAEGIGRIEKAPARAFDKLFFRESFARDAAYLLVQGYEGGYRWQGHQQAANCIVRYVEHGHLFLVQNSRPHTHYDKNGVHIGRSSGAAPLPPFASCDGISDYGGYRASLTSLEPYHGTTWTRAIVRSQAVGGFFLVLDRIAVREADTYRLTCTWRTPAFAKREGRVWWSEQGDFSFILRCGGSLTSSLSEERNQGATQPYVLRQAQTGTFEEGALVGFHNLFRTIRRGEVDRLDLHSTGPTGALVLEEGQAMGWCGWPEDSMEPVNALFDDADGLWWISVGEWIGTAVCKVRGGMGFAVNLQSERPLNVRVDLQAGRIFLEADPVGGRPKGLRLELDGRAVTGDPFLREGWPISADPGTAEVLQKMYLKSGYQTPEDASAPRPAPAAIAARHPGGTPVPRRLRNLRVAADPEPSDGFSLQLIDGILPELREHWNLWPDAGLTTITLDLPEPEPLHALELLGDTPEDPTLLSFQPLPEGMVVEAIGADGKGEALAIEKVADTTYRRYRDMENRMERYRVAFAGRSPQQLRIRIPQPPEGRSLVLHEVMVSTEAMIPSRIEHVVWGDLNGDGKGEIAIATAFPEILVLDERLELLWRHEVDKPVTHLSLQPLDPEGPPVLCAGVIGGDIHLLEGDGQLRKTLSPGAAFYGEGRPLNGWYNLANSMAVWNRDASGHGALVVGGYAILLFLSPEGELLGHSWADGSWIEDLLPLPKKDGTEGDLIARCGWNHGIFHYEGGWGFEPSGEHLDFGGVAQAMFRPLRRVAPFLNGASLAFERLPEGGGLFAATELGCGVYDLQEGDWRWKREGGHCLRAAALGRREGRPVAAIGGVEGFLWFYVLASGEYAGTFVAGEPILAVSAREEGGWLVATREHVCILGPDGAASWFATEPAESADLPGGDRVLMLDAAQCLTLYQPQTP